MLFGHQLLMASRANEEKQMAALRMQMRRHGVWGKVGEAKLLFQRITGAPRSR